MAESLEDRYEKAAAKVRSNPSEANRKAYHALRDELAERTRAARADRGVTGSVDADTSSEV